MRKVEFSFEVGLGLFLWALAVLGIVKIFEWCFG